MGDAEMSNGKLLGLILGGLFVMVAGFASVIFSQVTKENAAIRVQVDKVDANTTMQGKEIVSVTKDVEVVGKNLEKFEKSVTTNLDGINRKLDRLVEDRDGARDHGTR